MEKELTWASHPDRGCKYIKQQFNDQSITCLNCPLPKCRGDDGFDDEPKEIRNRKIWEMFEGGIQVKVIAKIFKLSERQISNILASKKRFIS